MIEETLRKLNDMKLFAMADKMREFTHNNQSGHLDSTEQLACMVDAEYDRRKNNRIKRLLGNAKIKLTMACVEDIDYSPARNLKKDALTDILRCDFIEHHHNVLISGATGTGMPVPWQILPAGTGIQRSITGRQSSSSLWNQKKPSVIT